MVSTLIDVGAYAPDVTLLTTHNQARALAALWCKRPLLLYFLRNIGCSLCTGHVAELARRNDLFLAANTQIVLVMALDADGTAQFARTWRLPFLVLADPDRGAYRAFGLTSPSNTFSPAFRHMLEQQYGADLPTPPHSLTQGGVYMIDQEGIVRYAFSSTSIEPYPPAADYLAALESLYV